MRDNLVEHILHIQRRINRLREFAQHLQLAHRTIQFLGARLDFLFEAMLRLRQLRSREIDLLGQQLQFITGLDIDTMIQLATPDARRSVLQQPDRRHHALSQQRRQYARQRQPQHQYHRATQQTGAELLMQLRQRTLHKDQPPQRRRHRVRDQRFTAITSPTD